MGSLADVESWTHTPHVVVVPNSQPGHSIPFLQFSRRLASAGIVTTFLTTDRHCLELRRSLGATDWTAEGVPLRIVGMGDGKVELTHGEWTNWLKEREVELQVVRMMAEAVVEMSSPAARQLRGVEAAAAPVCIMHDMFAPWAQEVADRLGVVKHLLYVSPASALSVALRSTFPSFAKGLIPLSKENRDEIISDIPGLPPISALDLPSPFLITSMYNWMHPRHLTLRKVDVILINTFYELEKTVLDALRNEVLTLPDFQAKCILDIGPLLPESYVNDVKIDGNEGALQETDPCILWLNTRPADSVLFVSFGSAATHRAPQLMELALGLEASGCSFLWIVRPPDTPGMSAMSENPGAVTEFLPPGNRVKPLVKPSSSPAIAMESSVRRWTITCNVSRHVVELNLGFEERVTSRGMCYSGWAPQMRILKHAAIRGFLSHCGWNSSLESVCAGVPVLAWPKWAEQQLNRRYLVETAKVAIELKPNAYTKEELESDVVRPEAFYSREEIAKKVRSLMQEAEGEVVRQNVRKIQADAREAGAPGGSSQRNFEAYVRLLYSYGECNGDSNGHGNDCSNGHSNGLSVASK